MNISLPESLKDYVEAQVRDGGYSTPSEYVRELLRQDQLRRAEEKLEALLLEGLRSGRPIKIDKEFLDRKRKQLLERQSRKSSIK